MISLTQKIPHINLHLCEAVKINCNRRLYKDISQFWVQDENRAVISMLDGNMVIYNRDADIEELAEFIGVISPSSVFSSAETMKKLFGNDFDSVCVMKSDIEYKSDLESDTLNSGEIYGMFNTVEFELPPYEDFAVDFCYRLNHGDLKYFAKKDICAAVCITDGTSLMLNGVVSYRKKMGSAAVSGVLSKFNRLPVLAVCKPEICGFYKHNGFKHIYNCGYRRKNS